MGSETYAPGMSADEAQQQGLSQQITKQLVELFGDADQTSIRMQGSTFDSQCCKFSGVTDPDTRAKLQSVGLLKD